jgi:hypothetical protein
LIFSANAISADFADLCQELHSPIFKNYPYLKNTYFVTCVNFPLCSCVV